MKNICYLSFLEKNIHSVIAATTDDDGFPITCAVDIMDSDENGLYFLTAKGKGFYHRLKKSGNIALTGLKGKNTLSSISISIRGKVRELGSDRLSRLLEKNPYMNEIYPTADSQKALTVFQIYSGSVEWFDLSQKPIERASFTFGNAQIPQKKYRIGDFCIGCQSCQAVCPQNCIDFSKTPAVIRQENCLHCGNCMNICPQKAVFQQK